MRGCRVHHGDGIAVDRRGLPAMGPTKGHCDDRSRGARDNHNRHSQGEPWAPRRRPGRTGGSGCRFPYRSGESGVVLQDRLLQGPQVEPGLDSKVACQPLPAVAVAGECIGLSTFAIERKHQLPEHALVVRLGRDGTFKAGNQLVVATESEGDVDALGPRDAPLVIESRRREVGVRLECDIG